MVDRMRASLTATRIAALAAALALLAGCGSQLKGGTTARANAAAALAAPGGACSETVMAALSTVLRRVYDEGLRSERTFAAAAKIEGSVALRAALESGDATAATRAARQLLTTRRMTALQVFDSSGHRLASVGVPSLAPVRGLLKDADGRTIGRYVESVWSDEGFLSEGDGVAQGLLTIRRGPQTLAGAPLLPARSLPPSGAATIQGSAYRYTSLAASEFPDGAPLQVYLLRTSSSIAPLCGASSEATVVNTLSAVARLIYKGEAGPRTLVQVRRVQHDAALLSAVAAGDAEATRSAIKALLNEHIVRLRVSGRDGLLADVGGPYVLAPVTAPLSEHGRRIGKFVLSIQDDEGYLRLARRLAGLKVLMYMGDALVKNSLGAGGRQSLGLDSVPAQGAYVYEGHKYRVVTVDAEAFPSGPLTIRVLIPIPYT